jgi:hypothetical protein
MAIGYLNGNNARKSEVLTKKSGGEADSEFGGGWRRAGAKDSRRSVEVGDPGHLFGGKLVRFSPLARGYQIVLYRRRPIQRISPARDICFRTG